MRKISFTILFLFASLLLAQDIDFRTEAFVFEGELSYEDPFQKEFGRYDAYQLQFNKGDFVRFNVHAEFAPLLVFVNPNNEYALTYPSEESQMVVYEREIEQTGTWLLYVVGDSLDVGKHFVNVNYVSAGAKKFSRNRDFCSSVQFLLAHANSGFFFLKEEKEDGAEDYFDSKFKFEGALNTEIVSKWNETFRTTLFDGDRQKSVVEKYEGLYKTLTECLGGYWYETEVTSIESIERKGRERVKCADFKQVTPQNVDKTIRLELTKRKNEENYKVEFIVVTGM